MPGVVFQPEAELESAPREAVLMEGIIGSRSTFVGKTLRELNFRQRYGVLILAVHRQGKTCARNSRTCGWRLATRSSCRGRRKEFIG